MAPSAALYSLLAPYAARHSSDVRVDFAPDFKSDPTGIVEAVSRWPLSAGREGALPPLTPGCVRATAKAPQPIYCRRLGRYSTKSEKQ